MILYFHNPNPNPYLIDLLSFRYADIVVVNDKFQYNRKSAAHRAKIGNEWLALPTKDIVKNRLIADIQVSFTEKFAYSLQQKLAFHYNKKTHFDYFKAEVEASILQAVQNSSSMLRTSLDICRDLLAFVEWPITAPIHYVSELNEMDQFESLDISELNVGFNMTIDGILHDYQSRNYQRQSQLSRSFKPDVLSLIINQLKLPEDATLLDLLFQYGAYHNLLDWPSKAEIL